MDHGSGIIMDHHVDMSSCIKYHGSGIIRILTSSCIKYHGSWIMAHGSSGHHVIMLTFDLVISLYFLCHIVIRLKFLKGGGTKGVVKTFYRKTSNK